MSLKLVPASVFDGKEIWELLQEFPHNDNGFINPGYDLDYKEFKDLLNSLIDDSNGIDLGPGFVPQTTYWLYKDNIPVGISKLRDRLNKKLRNIGGGHIGYAIRPSQRGNNYGQRLLELTLNKAEQKGQDQILLTVQEDNTGSRIVAEKCGAKLEKIENGTCFYWVLLGEN